MTIGEVAFTEEEIVPRPESGKTPDSVWVFVTPRRSLTRKVAMLGLLLPRGSAAASMAPRTGFHSSKSSGNVR